jgi:membrane associated rhomboid family serine protease
MTQWNNLTRPIDSNALGIRMLIGAAVGLALIGSFLLTAGEPNPEWPSHWRIKPLIMAPLAGATGGVFFYFMHYIFTPTGAKKILINLLCFAVFMIGLWMGVVLGLNGTYWD